MTHFYTTINNFVDEARQKWPEIEVSAEDVIEAISSGKGAYLGPKKKFFLKAYKEFSESGSEYNVVNIYSHYTGDTLTKVVRENQKSSPKPSLKPPERPKFPREPGGTNELELVDTPSPFKFNFQEIPTENKEEQQPEVVRIPVKGPSIDLSERDHEDQVRLEDEIGQAANLNPYLKKKKISVVPGVLIKGGKNVKEPELLIPMCSFSDKDGKIYRVAYQRIVGDGKGKKFFERGVKTNGLFFLIEGTVDSDVTFFCEGYATGYSLWLSSGANVVVCFSANNIGNVLETFLKLNPPLLNTEKFYIAADNDLKGKKSPNIGLAKASKTSTKYGVSFVFPEFSGRDSGKADDALSDFNDLYCSEGIDAVLVSLRSSFIDVQYNNSLVHERELESIEPWQRLELQGGRLLQDGVEHIRYFLLRSIFPDVPDIWEGKIMLLDGEILLKTPASPIKKLGLGKAADAKLKMYVTNWPLVQNGIIKMNREGTGPILVDRFVPISEIMSTLPCPSLFERCGGQTCRPDLCGSVMVGTKLNSYSNPIYPAADDNQRRDLELFENLLSWVTGDGESSQEDGLWLKSWLAYLVQNPCKLLATHPFILGQMGGGKSTFSSLASVILGERGQGFNHDKIFDSNANRFYTWNLAEKRLIAVEEMLINSKTYNNFKNLTTNPTVLYERKGVDLEMRDRTANFIFTANPEDFPLKGSKPDERRLRVIYNNDESFIVDTQREKDCKKLCDFIRISCNEWRRIDSYYVPQFAANLYHYFKKYDIDMSLLTNRKRVDIALNQLSIEEEDFAQEVKRKVGDRKAFHRKEIVGDEPGFGAYVSNKMAYNERKKQWCKSQKRLGVIMGSIGFIGKQLNLSGTQSVRLWVREDCAMHKGSDIYRYYLNKEMV